MVTIINNIALHIWKLLREDFKSLSSQEKKMVKYFGKTLENKCGHLSIVDPLYRSRLKNELIPLMSSFLEKTMLSIVKEHDTSIYTILQTKKYISS